MNAFRGVPDFLTHVKLLEEQIDATQVELTKDKRTILCLTMALPEHLRQMATMWASLPEMTAEKAKEMLLEEHRREHELKKAVDSKARVGNFGKQSKINGKNNSKDNGNNGNSDNGYDTKWCKTCEKPGHTKEECWEGNPELAPDWLKEKKSRQQKGRTNFRTSYATVREEQLQSIY